ncbi:hypothetical protein IE53DRAFT_385323 [Violaceomyces palustris]|uniref:Uncharacterized protein n=1 Tax=Violaceomyces palustris TaxID=1673888 RepID=A0ACD0P2N7_9BASI|nr:hypothetical protein IE53DRAFT_385323 [Violaceomyces palustris]
MASSSSQQQQLVQPAAANLTSSSPSPSILVTAVAAAAAVAADGGGNPLASLVRALFGVLVALINLLTTLIAFSTITVPRIAYAILHYSLTLQLNFPSLALLFTSILIAAFVWLRYRHLNSYERLREVPIIKDEGFDLHPDVASAAEQSERGHFHNYLDDFLQAIRIFGFLEKPVFHELARHLQTKRIVAGDSLSLDSDFSFYIVVDGHVQVFAPLPPTNGAYQDPSVRPVDAFDDEDHNGYQLLNEVESGGTLSSLFTILSLFTEDVKLGFGDEAEQQHQKGGAGRSGRSQDHSRQSGANQPLRRRAQDSSSVFNHTPSSQLHLNAAALRYVPNATSTDGAVERLVPLSPNTLTGQRPRALTAASSSTGSTVQQSEAGTVLDQDGDKAQPPLPEAAPPMERSTSSLNQAPELQMPPAQAAAPFPHFSPPPNAQTPGTPFSSGTPGNSTSHSPLFHARKASSVAGLNDGFPATPGSSFSAFSSHGGNGQGRPSDSMSREGAGTVARATVDTTLAVIPAEAFKRLTKKFPNAAAHIVQVILTRLSRVTFHTAHKYLGLTKEVMRTEKTINELACFPLLANFYEQGGMERLRQRFLPEPKKEREPSEDDYFRDYEQWPEREAPRTPKASSDALKITTNFPRSNPSRRSDQGSDSTATWQSGPKTPWGHPDPVLRTPTSRNLVGPGDLLSMTGTDDDSYRLVNPIHSGMPTPKYKPRPLGSSTLDPKAGAGGLSKAKAESGAKAGGGFGTNGGNARSGEEELLSSFGVADFDLKTEIMDCISKSIGLAQAPPSPLTSYQASPMVNPQDALLQRSVFNSAFSSLSMLDAAMMGDDESSVTGGTTSSMAGGFQPIDLENEIEVRFFPAGSTLVKAGDKDAGLFYVIDGFLDVLVPPPEVDEVSDIRNPRQAPVESKVKTTSTAPRESSGAEIKGAGVGRSDKSNARVQQQRSARSASNRSMTGIIDPEMSNSGPRAMPSIRVPLPSESSKVGNALDGTLGGSRPMNRSTSSSSSPATKKGQGSASGGKPGANPAWGDWRGRADSEAAEHGQSGHSSPSGQRAIFTIGRGGIAGYLSSLLGAASYVDVKAKTDTYVGFLPAHALERMMEKRPIVLLTLCKRLLSLLSPLILHIDSALDWQQVNAGQVIYREGDRADSFYIVINGRLRSIAEKQGGGGGVEVLSEYGQGESVGELDVITNSPRRRTLHAIRDSELAKMPMTLFNAISVRHPAITIQISRIIARRVRMELEMSQRPGALSAPVPGLPDLGRNNLNLKTVAILPVTRQVPIAEFSSKLQAAFEDTMGGPTAFLNQSSVMGVLGRHAFSKMGKLKLAGWLAEQEQRYRLVLYVVDTPVSSAWSQTSIRQADCVLLVGFGDDPSMGEYERLLMSIKTTARKELVLLHPERSVPPGSTREWLKSRSWIHAHHHVEMPGITRSQGNHHQVMGDPKAVKALRNLKQKLEIRLQRYKGKHAVTIPGRPHHSSDFARLARRLCGKSIGLVLGGGGARGCAHLGVLRALEERGIPIDMVGGTSIGSLVGGLYAMEAEVVSSLGRAKRFAGRMASLWRFASDLTYPVVSYTTGHEFNRGIFKCLQQTHIEDMWLPFFCNTTNITWSRMEVHTTGYAWRYIRGSMTLAGLLPPLVDEGHMLVDGGYVDNLPVTVMLAMGARNVFAVDVGSIDDTSPRSYGDTLSGWWVLLNRWNPWSDARNIPSIPDIQGRLTYVSSVKTLEETKNSAGCFYMRMPVEGFGTLEFGKFDEIMAKGYEAAKTMLDEWEAEGKLPTGVDVESESEGFRRRRRAGVSARRNSV